MVQIAAVLYETADNVEVAADAGGVKRGRLAEAGSGGHVDIGATSDEGLYQLRIVNQYCHRQRRHLHGITVGPR